MAKYAAALDQGTTSTRCMIFDHGGNVVSVAQKEHEQIYPKPGWVEHDPKEIWDRTQEVMDEALDAANASADDIAGLGITNQRETTVVWDKNTGEPVMNAIVWQDTRTDRLVDELAREGGQSRFQEITGLPLATYFSGPKVRWILDNVDGARERADAGDVVGGRVRLLHRLVDDLAGARPDLRRVVLDPARLGIDLLVLLLRDADHLATVVEDHAARARGALVEGGRVLSHH